MWSVGFLGVYWWGWLLWAFNVWYWYRLWRREREHRRTRRGHHHPPAEGITLPAGTSVRTFTFAGAGARALDPAARVIPTRRQDDAIRAWKRASVQMTAEGWRFVGVGRGVRYNADEHASCVDGVWTIRGGFAHSHEPPQLDCGCGFYAMRHRADVEAWGTMGMPVLDVDLSGRVIRCTEGYRAQHQRVLAVRWPQVCDLCAAPAGVLVLPAAYERVGPYEATARCADHVGPRDAMITFDQLNAGLGTENRWLDD